MTRARASVTLGVVAALSLGPAAPVGAAAGTITTVAGKSPAGYSGDGGQARDAQMNEPRMATFDGAGNMYIVDTFNQVIRRVDVSGIITTVAGHTARYVPRKESDCRANFSGEGVPATTATLSCPHSVTVAANGDLYITDSSNYAIRKVDHHGIITTVVGKGGSGGDEGDGGPATAARINQPKSLVFDGSGNMIFTDSGNNKIKKVDAATGIITTIAGTGVTGSRGDGGPARLAEFHEPRTLTLALDGSILVTEPKAHRIRRIDPSGVVTTLAGTGRAGFSGDGGPAAEAMVNEARGVGVDGAGDIFIADSLNQRIRRIDAAGVITTVAGKGVTCYHSARTDCGDGGPATAAGFGMPRALEVDAHGALYVADTFNHRIRRIEGIAALVHHNTAPGPTG